MKKIVRRCVIAITSVISSSAIKKAVFKYLSLELNASREANDGQKVALCKYMHAFIS